MNIPLSAIQPFEPHGLPKLNFIKELEVTTLKIILDIMDALDKFMEDNAENCFMFASVIEATQAQALADHLCGWLEETAYKAGADIVHVKSRAMLAEYDNDELVPVFDTKNRKSKKLEIIGFMFMIEFTVNDEDMNHLLDHRFKRTPK